MSIFHFKIKKGKADQLPKGIFDSIDTIYRIENELIVDMPFPTTDFLFFKLCPDLIEISNDLRCLYSPEMLIDPNGLHSLLQYGAIAPPHTIFQEVKAFVPGFRYEININNMSIDVKCDMNWSSVSKRDRTMSDEEQIEVLSSVIRRKLEIICLHDEPVVLFSGGVDSGLLAAELALMGCKNTKLFHYSFGIYDPETLLAQSMAKELGLECFVVMDGSFNSYEVLDKAAVIYPFPFCDHSCLPTYSLAQAVIQNLGYRGLILDGTGADGAFGLFNKGVQLDYLYKVPWFVRNLIGEAYRLYRLWEHSSLLEYYTRLFRRSIQLPILSNSIAQNALLDIGFSTDESIIDLVSRDIEWWIRSISPSDNYSCLIPILDLALVCCGVFAQKNKPIFDSWGGTIAYPFLSRELVDLSIQHVRFWPGNEKTSKYALKKLLSTRVPKKMVYRKKSPFVASPMEKFSDLRFLKHFETTLDANSFLENVCNRKVLERLYFLLRTKHPLPHQTYNFVWAITFSNCWILQLDEIFQSSTQREYK